MELSRIILGIRLFNREEGRGGAGLDTMDKDSNLLANVLSQDIAMVITATIYTFFNSKKTNEQNKQDCYYNIV